MLKTYLLIFFAAFIIVPDYTSGQTVDGRAMTLQEVIDQAQGKTRRTTLADTRLTNAYWQYTAFQGSFKPRLTAEATLPDFNRSISLITQPNGDLLFTPQANNTLSAGLRIAQTIPSLGTQIFLYSGLERLDNFDGPRQGQSSYFSTPISIGLSQPLFQFNPFKWQQKIQPLEYKESEQRYTQDMELIAYDAVIAFFNYYIAQLDLEATILDKQNADSLYVLSKGRYSVGRIAETDLLQIELTVRSAEFAQAQAKIDLENSAEELRQLLNIDDDIYFNLAEPADLPEITIDPERAIEIAKENRAETTEFRRRLLEAERRVDEARKDNGVRLDLTGRFGLSQTDESLSGSYQNLLDQERITLTLAVPIADWGRSRAEREIAASERELAIISVSQEEEAFERSIDIQVRQLQLKKNFF